MDVIETRIPGVKRVVPKRFGDARGWFSETVRVDALARAGIACAFLQDNQSFSAPKGAILDVAVDLRRDSATYGQHVAVTLDATSGEQLFIPHSFAHGFCTLTPDTMVAYKVDAYYSPARDRALIWNDPEVAIDWPISDVEAILSDKDKAAPRLSELGPVF